MRVYIVFIFVGLLSLLHSNASARSRIGMLSLMDASNVNKICKNKDTKVLHWYVRKYFALNEWIKYNNETLHETALESCWLEHTEMSDPKDDETKWYNFICMSNSPGILINTVHHCFLRNVSHDGLLVKQANIKRYLRVTDVTIRSKIDRKFARERNIFLHDEFHDLSDLDCSDDEDEEHYEYCHSKREKVTRRKSLCQMKNDADLRAKEIVDFKCLQISAVKHVALIKQCWHLMTNSQYPDSDDKWLNFTCSHEYPYAMKQAVKKCVAAHLSIKDDAHFQMFFDVSILIFYPS